MSAHLRARFHPFRDWIVGRRGWRRLAVAAGLGVMAVAALPPIYLWVALIVAFTGWMWLIESAPTARSAFWTGWWFGLGYFVAGLYWIANALLTKPEEFGLLAPVAVLALSALMALFPAAAAATTRLLGRSGVGGVLNLAAAWTFFEWVRSWAFSGFPWNLVGSVWTFSDSMIQITSVVGTYGLSLITVAAAAMPAALAQAKPLATANRMDGRRALIAVVAAFAVLAAVGVGGMIRLALAGPEETVPGVRLRLVQPNIPQAEKLDPDRRGEHFLSQLRMGALPAEQPPTHVIWAEAAAPFFLADATEALALLGEATPPGGLTIVGALRRSSPATRTETSETTRIFNSLLAVDHSGRVVSTYDKSHLVPYGEYVPFRSLLGISSVAAGTVDFSPGPGIRTLALVGLPPVSPLICYEVIFPAAVADDADRPRWLLNLTNDGWYGRSTGPYQHFAATRLRAVEEGLPLVRVANTGISAIVDPYGRVVDELPLGAQGLLDGSLPTALSAPTLYARFGDALPFGLVALSAVAGFIVDRRRR